MYSRQYLTSKIFKSSRFNYKDTRTRARKRRHTRTPGWQMLESLIRLFLIESEIPLDFRTRSSSSPKYLLTFGLALHRVRNSLELLYSPFLEFEIPLDFPTRSLSSPKFICTFGLALYRVLNSFVLSDSLFIESEGAMCKSECRYVSFHFSVSLIKNLKFFLVH